MPRFKFSLTTSGDVREGIIQIDSFDAALSAITEHIPVSSGDSLEIGVQGFPPAHFMRVATGTDSSAWRQAGLLAA